MKLEAGPILRPRELRIGHEDEKMQVSIKNDCQGERKVFHHIQWLTVGLQQKTEFHGKRSSLVDNSSNR